MIKVPATAAGIPAIEELTARRVNVNVTLLFSLARYEQVIEAYIAGLERRLTAGERVDGIASVASFFVSRVDAKADAQLPAGSDLRGRVAIANARSAYRRYRERFTDARWLMLHDAGARPQRPLWASTGTKDAAYSDVLYVEELVVPDAINTMPRGDACERSPTTATPAGSFDWSSDAAGQTLRRAADAGVDLGAITGGLERAGVESFRRSYEELLDCIDSKLAAAVSKGHDGRAGNRRRDQGGAVPVEAGKHGGP